MTTEKLMLSGPGNALLLKEYIEREFPPLTWNMINIKMMRMLIRKKLNPTQLSRESEYDGEIINEYNRLLIEKTKRGLPI